MEIKPEIFISIASYRDTELIPTLRDMIQQSSGKYALSVAVCWQDEEDTTLFNQAGMTLCEKKNFEGNVLYIYHYEGARIQIISLHYFHSQGACWARHQSEKLYQQEDYFLQIDAHCRFIENWDCEIVTMLQQLKQHSGKPVLSTYPPGYEPDKEERTHSVFRLGLRGFTSEGIPQLSNAMVEGDAPVRGSYLAGGFIFADGSFVNEVPNDPHIFFEGEEISMAIRAFTHGYDVWHPHKILLWHYYGREESARIWSDHTDKAKSAGSVSQTWYERDKKSKRKVRTLLGLEEGNDYLQGIYKTGTVRTVEQFEEITGVDFKKRLALPEATDSRAIAWVPLPREKSWRRRLTNTVKKQISVSQSELDITWDNVTTLYVGVYSSNNDLLYKKNLTKKDIATALVGEDLNLFLTLSFAAMLTPDVIRFSSYDTNKGWGKTVENPW